MPFYDYYCKSGHKTTERRGYGVSTVLCACGDVSERSALNTPFIHGATTNQLSVDQLDPERFLDSAEYIDDAYTRADKSSPVKLKRPKGYKAGIVRARALQIEREGFNHKSVHKLNELDAKAV